MANDSLTRAQIIGDVLDPFTSSVPLTVMYDGRPVFNGMEFRSPAVSLKPRVEIGGDDFRVAYTLVMMDPDAPNPSNPTLREYLHWMVTDVPASTNDSFGREIVTYESPNPTMGIHRMVLVLYQQLGRGTVFAPQVRHNFNSRSFARRFNLGKPVAAIYFNCQRPTGTGGRRFT
ncbi:protein FLOWERING LOCUS T [Brachypodium distachyon]|uniref:Uncharacterized protein n=2 Tax=Pooideae TaxID=147368 RepID=I1GY33_BRADI|nr:protein FLOWERING LOCUS T [Brachypodium distachyon]KQK18033.1 hypothetical protein BRADI_1g38150v3 [Brachypodium distachyon]|eukprot:XP_003563772.1 protein FLOWERING LOCUS T [Brachypodium distachyon]